MRGACSSASTVISDRYIPSGLVMQRFDGIDPAFLWQLNAEADRPDLAVILEADTEVIAERLTKRGSPVHTVRRAQLARGDQLRCVCVVGARRGCCRLLSSVAVCCPGVTYLAYGHLQWTDRQRG